MIPGFNHNVRYKGKIYHVQTEDSGDRNPHITTLLYEGGTILARKRTSYADILSSSQRGVVVRDLMEKQHKEMLRLLKSGRFEAPQAGNAAPRENAADGEGRASLDREDSLDEILVSYLAGNPSRRSPAERGPTRSDARSPAERGPTRSDARSPAERGPAKSGPQSPAQRRPAKSNPQSPAQRGPARSNPRSPAQRGPAKS